MPYAALHAHHHVLQNPSPADLQKLAATATEPGLIIFGYPSPSLQPLAVFSKLESLKMQGAPKLTSLEGVESLKSLKELVLSTPTGSDGSGRCIEVDSLAPLKRLGSLTRLILQGVKPRDLDLAPIMQMHQLEDVDIGGVPEFVLEHFASLAAALPKSSGRCLQPFVEIPGIGICRKCQQRQVLLNGAPPRARKWVCRKCNEKLFTAHVRRWEEAVNLAKSG